MKSSLLFAVLFLLYGCLTSLTVAAQESATAPAVVAASNVVPSLINYNGVLKDATGRTLTTVTGVTFLLYKDEQGGAPLWLETQNATPDKTGRYTVQLGAASKNGIPSDLFVSGEGRWLAVQIGNETEQPRVLLVAVPYAMKAVDAQTLGGLPPSAFVLAAPPASVTAPASPAEANNTAATSNAPLSRSVAVTTSGGAANVGTIALFSTATDIEKSLMTQTGTIAINVGGKLNLPATGTATAVKGFNSQPQQFVASVFNSTTSTAVPQNFAWQVEPVNNDKTTASGTLNLLYASGTAALAETGVKISNKGLFTFAAGQAFPGTGTVTSVTAGAGLAGGTITKTGTISIAAGGVTNADLTHSSLTVTAGTDLTGGGLVALGSSTTLNLDTTRVPTLAASNTFTGATNTFTGNVSAANLSTGGQVSGVTGSFTGEVSANEFFADTSTSEAVAGISTVSNGVYGESDNDAAFQAATYGWEFGSTTENLGLWGYSASAVGAGVYGESVNSSGTGAGFSPNAGVWGDTGTTTNDGVLGTADDGFPIVGFNNSTARSTAFFENETTGSSTAPVFRTVGSGFGGACTIDVSGNFSCNGSKSAVVPVDNGTRKVALYAVEAPENWFEDFGSGTLSGGAAVVALEPTFAQTVNTVMEYHVFLTPKGDCKGLYVANETSAGFEVHELGGGQSSVAFDYRIVAHRKGYESIRLADKTKESQYPTPNSVRKAGARPPIPMRHGKAAAKLPAAKVQTVGTHR